MLKKDMKFIKFTLTFFASCPIWANNCQFDTQCHFPAKCIKQADAGTGRCIMLDPEGNKIFRRDKDPKTLPNAQATPEEQPSPAYSTFDGMFETDNKDK